MTQKFYQLIPGTDILRSKIDVFEWTNPADEKDSHRVELIVDNDGVCITAVGGDKYRCRETVSIAEKSLAIAVACAILEAYGV